MELFDNFCLSKLFYVYKIPIMKERVKKNRHFSGVLKYTGHKHTPTDIQFIQYSPTLFHEQKTNDIRQIISSMKENTVNWIRVTGMSDQELIVDIVKGFGLSILDAKDVLTPEHIVSIDELDNTIFLVFTAIYYTSDHTIATEHISLILGTNFVISFQESERLFFERVYHVVKNKSLKADTKGADFLLGIMLSEIIEKYTETISLLEDNLEDLEDKLLDFGKNDKSLMVSIQEKRRDVIRLRKILLPLKEQFIKLLHSDKTLIQKSQLPYYRDLNDQILYILQTIESCREITSSLVDLYLNNNDLKMNVIMKQLTVVATIFIPLTFLAGVWGMNFRNMPELEHRYGYPFAWGIMIVVGLSIWIYFKKKDWF